MKSKNYRSISFLEILQLVFITLKILNLIQWKWIWVLSPAWIELLLTLFIMWGKSDE